MNQLVTIPYVDLSAPMWFFYLAVVGAVIFLYDKVPLGGLKDKLISFFKPNPQDQALNDKLGNVLTAMQSLVTWGMKNADQKLMEKISSLYTDIKNQVSDKGAV